MIELKDVSKRYPVRGGETVVLDEVSLRVEPGERVGILGRNGAGKSTLVRIIGGSEQPTSGHVRRDMLVSWPLALGGGVHLSLTGYDNLRFICRIYGVAIAERLAFIEEFSELGRYLYEPVKTYSAGMRARLAFGISMAVNFDCYLIDEIAAVGDERFRQKCEEELFGRRGDKAFIIVSHVPAYIRKHCQRALILHNAKLTPFDDIDEALAHHNAMLKAG